MPRFPYERALRTILPHYAVSLVFVSSAKARSLNTTLRGKDYIPNVLSYETGEKSGEIVICLEEAKRQAPEHGLSYPHFVGFLFIHACLHLKGHPHGTTMERLERALLARILSSPLSNETTNRNGHRHRHARDARRRR